MANGEWQHGRLWNPIHAPFESRLHLICVERESDQFRIYYSLSFPLSMLTIAT